MFPWHLVNIIEWHCQGFTERDIANLYLANFPGERQPAKTTIRRIVTKFRVHATLEDRRRYNKRPVNVEAHQTCCQAAVENPKVTLRQIQDEHGISKSSAGYILKKNKFKPYRFTTCQPLTQAHIAARLEFCQRMIPALDIYPELSLYVCFTDESSFGLVRHPNRQNVRHWAMENPYNNYETK